MLVGLCRFVVTNAHEAIEALGLIMKAVASGEILPSEGSQLTSRLSSYVKTREIVEIEAHLAALEAKSKVHHESASQDITREELMLEAAE
jgi:hypothetical protein